MGDWFGLLFLVLLALGAVIGLRALANQRPRTSEEFERNAANNTTAIGAFMNALHEVTDPSATKAKEVRMQMKDGRYLKKRSNGKANANADETETESE